MARPIIVHSVLAVMTFVWYPGGGGGVTFIPPQNVYRHTPAPNR